MNEWWCDTQCDAMCQCDDDAWWRWSMRNAMTMCDTQCDVMTSCDAMWCVNEWWTMMNNNEQCGDDVSMRCVYVNEWCDACMNDEWHKQWHRHACSLRVRSLRVWMCGVCVCVCVWTDSVCSIVYAIHRGVGGWGYSPASFRPRSKYRGPPENQNLCFIFFYLNLSNPLACGGLPM